MEGEREGNAINEERVCNGEQALQAMGLMERGARQAFLDGELGIEKTKQTLDRIKAARQACEGDESACVVLHRLIDQMTEGE